MGIYRAVAHTTHFWCNVFLNSADRVNFGITLAVPKAGVTLPRIDLTIWQASFAQRVDGYIGGELALVRALADVGAGH